MPKGSITSTNALLFLSIDGVFPVPQQLQNFSADDIYSIEDVDPVETSLSLDGQLSGGKIPYTVTQGITLMANSDSGLIFDAWNDAMTISGDIFTAEGSITLTSLSQKYICTRGFLRGYKPVPEAAKTLKARKFTIQWQSVLPQPF